MRRVVVTGGGGFLAGALVRELRRVAPGLEIVAADLKIDPPEGWDSRVRFHGGVDVTNPETLRGVFRNADAVFHLAGLGSYWRADRDRLYRVNRDGTRNVLDACAAAGVGRLVHVSSTAAIGFKGDPEDPADEELTFDWARARGKHYMLSKRDSERALDGAAGMGVSAATACPASLYGPGDAANMLRLYSAIAAGKIRMVPPGGNAVVDVRDAARGLVLLAESGAQDERFILAGENLTFPRLTEQIGQALGRPLTPGVLPRWLRRPLGGTLSLLEPLLPRSGMIAADDLDAGFHYRYFSSRKARERLGWVPQYSFRDSARDAVAFLRGRGLLAPSRGPEA